MYTEYTQPHILHTKNKMKVNSEERKQKENLEMIIDGNFRCYKGHEDVIEELKKSIRYI